MMRRSGRLLSLAAAAACSLLAPSAAVAAAPTGTDFTQPVAGVERSMSHGENGFRSEVLVAPQRFDLAGLEGESREAELRGRVTGGEWTEWTETANGDPVWFGGMDELQVRTHGWKPGGRVHYVAVAEGSEPAVASRGTNGMPTIISRRAWGANQNEGGCEPRQGAEYGKVKAASVHHTVSAVKYSEAEAKAMILGICRFHRNSNGWNDIGYNALIDRFGNIYAGRAGGLDRAVVGAQAQSVNAQTSGVALLGTHTSTPISDRAVRALVDWLSWKLPEHGLDGTGKARMTSAGGETARYAAGVKFKTLRIIGHRVTNYTACPGDALAAQLPKVREKVLRRIGGSANSGGGNGGGIG